MRPANYNKFPSTKISGTIYLGWKAIYSILEKDFKTKRIIAFEFYTGVFEEEIINKLKLLSPSLFINTRNLMKSEDEIMTMTERFMTNDHLFGYITNLTLNDYFNVDKLEAASKLIAKETNGIIIVGPGASLLAPAKTTLVYVDMPRWEIQQRFRMHSVKALGIDNHNDAVSLQYKRGYFNDWRILDKHKERIFQKVDYWLDTHIANSPKMIDKNTFFNGIEETIKTPFRVVPFFDPSPWGGQWMKDICGLNPKEKNYGWCFDCVPEENSLYFEVNNIRYELPSINLVLLKSRELLGEPVEARFGKEFPIRFDFLDTIGGGNLSLQVHPTTQFIHENFGMYYTQDESYYLLDAKEDASVFLGLKTGIEKDKMIHDLNEAQKDNHIFDTEKYINKLSAKKHDHYLIPAGTVHCSGANALVLEISSTPNLFTFKLWDWQRMGLDGKPRPINIERGKNVIDWGRNTEYVNKNLVNHISQIASGNGWREERTGLHPNEFIETRRHWFSVPITHYTNNSVNVLNLIEGEEAIIESPTHAFKPFVVHYAETFIVPASICEYTISPYGKSEGKECATIKAYVRY